MHNWHGAIKEVLINLVYWNGGYSCQVLQLQITSIAS